MEVCQITDQKKSQKDHFWQFASFDEKTAQFYAQKYNLPVSIARIMSSRGIMPEDAESFLTPKLKYLMPSPFILEDMEKAVDYAINIIEKKEKIGVFGDYDVDGGTSSALLFRFLKMLGGEVCVHIPDRMTEGYGPNIKAFKGLQKKGCDTIITVDCGSAAPDVMCQAREQGMHVLILDHHLTQSATEGAYATVNPNRNDDFSGLGDLTAAGVSFLFCVAVVKKLRAKEFFKQNNLKEPDLLSLLDLVALGTICDVAPLTYFNRALVASGLKVFASGQNQGLYHLARVGSISEEISTYHCGFVLGPRINAGGRVGRASAGFELLTTDCPIEAEKLAKELDHYNAERKTMEDMIREEAFAQIEEEKLYEDPVIIAHGPNWHPGIVGIVASRIKDHYHKPSFILGADDTGIYKGSGRSISGIDIGSAIKEAKEKGLIIAGGGHKMAAGLSLSEEQIELLRTFFKKTLTEKVQEAKDKHRICVDVSVPLSAVHFDFFQAIQKLAPFGVGNASPTICLENVNIGFFKIIGSDHLKIKFQDSSGNFVNAVCFRCLNTPIGEALMQKKLPLDVIGTIKQDTYHTGNNVQFIIDDVRYV